MFLDGPPHAIYSQDSLPLSRKVTAMLRTLLLTLIGSGIALSATAASNVEKVGNMYKWTDENGRVHYSNAPPPEAAKHEREVLNQQGVKVEELAAQKTPEELAEMRRQQELAEQRAKEAAAQAERDRILTSTYTSVADIERARDNRLQAIEAQIRVTSGSISSLEQQIAELEKTRKALAGNNREIPPYITTQLENARAQLLENQQFLMEREKEKQEVREKFGADIRRYRELKGLPAEPAPAAGPAAAQESAAQDTTAGESATGETGSAGRDE